MMTLESIEKILLKYINYRCDRIRECELALQEAMEINDWPDAREAMLEIERLELSADSLSSVLSEIRRDWEKA